MKKLIIFDLDGVLVETKMLHYNSLNEALREISPDYIISWSEHLSIYDGLPTNKKLNILSKNKGLSPELHETINKNKQNKTFELIKKDIKRDEKLCILFDKLKKDGFIIYVASNSIRETVKLLLLKTGLIEWVDYYLSNEDIKKTKPHSEIYLKCMIHAGCNPDEVLIVEDSPHGIESAQKSGANLLVVKNPNDITYEKIINKIENKKNMKFDFNNLNVLVPMAGEGSRFKHAGFTFPKPLIEVEGKPMIQTVVDSLQINANYIYIVRKEHYEKYNLKYLLELITPNCKIVQVDELTEGAACTTLLAKQYIDNNNPLLIVNSDQYIDWNPVDFYYLTSESKCDGSILTFENTHPKWSYVKIDNNGYITELAEKKVISNIATVGIYYWKEGSEYVRCAEQMINKNIRVNNEFYVAPVYNEALLENKKINIFNVNKMLGLGTPEDLDFFLKNK